MKKILIRPNRSRNPSNLEKSQNRERFSFGASRSVEGKKARTVRVICNGAKGGGQRRGYERETPGQKYAPIQNNS